MEDAAMSKKMWNRTRCMGTNLQQTPLKVSQPCKECFKG